SDGLREEDVAVRRERHESRELQCVGEEPHREPRWRREPIRARHLDNARRSPEPGRLKRRRELLNEQDDRDEHDARHGAEYIALARAAEATSCPRRTTGWPINLCARPFSYRFRLWRDLERGS